MKSMRWFITGYERNGRFEASATAGPSDDAGCGKQFDDLLYSDEAQDDGMQDPLYCVRDFQARVLNTQLNHEPNTSELDREIEAFALDMQASDPESNIWKSFAAGYESDRNMAHERRPAQGSAYLTTDIRGARGEVPYLARDIGESCTWRPTMSEEGQA
ncbi:hypothetical protein [Streptomyces sp. NPDC050704]|uniref:hypothetical protein n=1 Tax=Streptomyces sp. NPDC050704 TaxID=3157219 RepID=UPI00341AE1A6